MWQVFNFPEVSNPRTRTVSLYHLANTRKCYRPKHRNNHRPSSSRCIKKRKSGTFFFGSPPLSTSSFTINGRGVSTQEHALQYKWLAVDIIIVITAVDRALEPWLGEPADKIKWWPTRVTRENKGQHGKEITANSTITGENKHTHTHTHQNPQGQFICGTGKRLYWLHR